MSLQFSLPYILYLQDSSMPPPCVHVPSGAALRMSGPKLPEYEMPTDYMQNEFTVDSEGESDTSLELSSEDSDSDTETN